LVLGEDRPQPRIVEALPAVLAWNAWNIRLLYAYARSADSRVLHRVAWLADITLTIDRERGFPGGCPARAKLARIVKTVKPPREHDGLGWHDLEAPLPPVSRRWNVSFPASLADFRKRAEHLWKLRMAHQRVAIQ
jgi:hypothetical protein